MEPAELPAIDEETEELLDKLNGQGGVGSDKVEQLRKDLAAAAPESQPFLKSLLALTVGARAMPEELKPRSGPDETGGTGDGGRSGQGQIYTV